MTTLFVGDSARFNVPAINISSCGEVGVTSGSWKVTAAGFEMFDVILLCRLPPNVVIVDAVFKSEVFGTANFDYGVYPFYYDKDAPMNGVSSVVKHALWYQMTGDSEDAQYIRMPYIDGNSDMKWRYTALEYETFIGLWNTGGLGIQSAVIGAKLSLDVYFRNADRLAGDYIDDYYA